ncbi:hypothetical protein KX729_21895 [Rhizobium sp. XQZ8]|uniref:hypothetical protein n=1 Tax=Rhizobium populisoli TaxID=2859785 RepID=UPI001CA47A13|nr:hypothetical protein [Rhizobium populisoli]MBW6424121.1 hypothetical protein [Rhizobium populisoli]
MATSLWCDRKSLAGIKASSDVDIHSNMPAGAKTRQKTLETWNKRNTDHMIELQAGLQFEVAKEKCRSTARGKRA